MTVDPTALIAALDTEDTMQQRQAGDDLLAAGAAALPALRHGLRSGPLAVRKAAAFLLGAFKASEGLIEDLGRAVVEDEEPKVRKNAAVSLGKLGAAAAIEPLAEALRREQVAWIRPSLILALGAVGGEQAHEVLAALAPATKVEGEALRKALDRSAPRRRGAVGWRTGATTPPLLLSTPVGLERVALDEATDSGLVGVTFEGPGLLRCPLGVAPRQLLPGLRCSYGPMVDSGVGPPLPHESARALQAVRALLEQSAPLRQLREWLVSEEDTIRYRFSFEGGGVKREALRDMLAQVRAVCQPLGLEDSPSNYAIELIVASDAAGSRLLIRPSFLDDNRFRYRQKEVGGAIHPVVAACLARLVRTSASATVFDPTCGGGTLLIERALLGPAASISGADVSPNAVAASRANLKAASLEKRVKVAVGDASQPSHWPQCDEVLANLPFGLRTRRENTDLDQLYPALVAQIAAHLRPGGRALLYTTSKELLDTALAKSRLRVLERFKVHSGGLWVHLWLLTVKA